MGSQDPDQEGPRAPPLPLRDVSRLQQGGERFQRQEQIHLQEQTLCTCSLMTLRRANNNLIF